MRQNSNRISSDRISSDLNQTMFDRVTYLAGSSETIENMIHMPPKKPFDSGMCEFLNDLSKALMKNPASRLYSDIITFAFWIRKSSLTQLKERFSVKDNNIHFGRGIAFHIAPSNVPVNFAYSLVAGLLTGNANIVRVSSKHFTQVEIIASEINRVLEQYDEIRPYISLIRYERDKDINDLLSSISDTRIIWGGDETIAELRKSPLPSRSTEVTFADRYSIAVIDSDSYMAIENKVETARDFYNDTYFSDQNACTSPRIIVWMGNRKEDAKELFWQELYDLIAKKYTLQPVQAVNKLTNSYLTAANISGTKIEKYGDNRIIRVSVPEIKSSAMELKDNSGYFFEYDCNDILDLKPLCDDNRCQTIAYIGKKDMFYPLLTLGIKGVDRVVPIGKTMDFDLIWDGYNLTRMLTRVISIS